jgi:hypothetical protein
LFAVSPLARAHGHNGADALTITFPDQSLDGSGTGSLAPAVAPNYHSLPSATAKLYLDFTGDVNNNWGGYTPGVTPAYDIDGDPTTFSTTELSNINEMWQRVAEKYSPFNIDVTTQDPGNLNHGQVMKVVIGGDGSNGRVDAQGNKIYWAGGRYGGISWVGSFAGGLPNVAYVFPGNLGNGIPRYSAEASAHEAGHGFGLVHQSDYVNGSKLNEYSLGTYIYDPNLPGIQQPREPGTKSPIMGNSYFADRGLWWSGTSSDGPNQIQNDLSVITSSFNGFGYRPDGPNNSFATAAPLTIDGSGVLRGQGVIEQMTDKDYFSFDSTGGLSSFLVDVAPFGAMLDASVALYDSNGNLITQSATDSLSEFISADLSPGTYDLVVSGAGNYGDIGQYFISGALGGALVPEPAVGSVLLVTFVMLRRRNRVG